MLWACAAERAALACSIFASNSGLLELRQECCRYLRRRFGLQYDARTETLITYPTTQTHADVKEEVRLKNGITPCTLRLSTGIEDAEDLIADLESAFAGV